MTPSSSGAYALPPDLIEAIDEVRRELCPAATATLLYGSRAMGTHGPDSDVDLYFVTAGRGRLVELRALRHGFRFQIALVPRAVLPHLASVSRRARRPIGLFGPAYGRLVHGELPELEDLARAARDAVAAIDGALRPDVEQKTRTALGTAEMALAAADPTVRLAMALRAVPMLLETELQRLCQDHIGSRSRHRLLAAGNPAIVAGYGEIMRAALAEDFAPLAACIERLRGVVGDDPATETVRVIAPEQLGLAPRPQP
jgi:predicted nucleotidyltransferase